MVEHYRHADITERLNAMETLDSSLNLAQIEWKK
ncbi:phage integrase family protein [Bifidobacterium mongoliense]|nr:phage integrase family protein [Bifidobacterium mongoliense]